MLNYQAKFYYHVDGDYDHLRVFTTSIKNSRESLLELCNQLRSKFTSKGHLLVATEFYLNDKLYSVCNF